MNWVSDDIFQSQFLLFFSQPSTSFPLPASTWRTVNHHPGLSTIIPHFLPFFFWKSQKYFISGIWISLRKVFRIQTRYNTNKQKQDFFFFAGDLHTEELLKYSYHQLRRVLCPSWCFHTSVPLHHWGHSQRSQSWCPSTVGSPVWTLMMAPDLQASLRVSYNLSLFSAWVRLQS